MELNTSKTILARLMSEENIVVEQRSVDTAYFDTTNRVLVVPTFTGSALSNDVMDLLLSHECSHALNTPNEKWLLALDDGINKHILNVLEDVRVEKLIKLSYPGLRAIYFRGYNELNDIDFFGLEKININKINLIDKINLYYKIGPKLFLVFNEIEQKLLELAGATNTFKQVVTLSKFIEKYIKATYKNEKITTDTDLKQFGASLGISIGDIEIIPDNGDDIVEKESKENAPPSGDSSGEESGKTKPDDTNPTDKDDMEIESETQNHLDEQLKSLTKLQGSTNNIKIESVNIDDFIVDYSRILKRFINGGYLPADASMFNKFKDASMDSVSYLAREFNLKKNAKTRQKTRISTTGDINPSKLFNYKISDDIFKRKEIAGKEKDHGLIFFLDWSSSMHSYINDTIKQLLNMVLFCRKCNIPFEVYAFTTDYKEAVNSLPNSNGYYEKPINPKAPKSDFSINFSRLTLMNLFSSKMDNADFALMSNYLLNFNSNNYSGYFGGSKNKYPGWFSLGGTPLNDSILLLDKVVNKFKTRYKPQIINTIFLTDGESAGIMYSSKIGDTYCESLVYDYGRSTNFLRHEDSNYIEKVPKYSAVRAETDFIVSYMKTITNIRMFSFRLSNRLAYTGLEPKLDTLGGLDPTRFFSKNNYIEVKSNFDKYYILKTNVLNDDADIDVTEGESTASIARKFGKVAGNSVNNKLFLKKFIEFIS